MSRAKLTVVTPADESCADKKSTSPMVCLNDVACLVTQSRAIIDTIIDAHVHGEQPIDPDALYGVRTLLDCAFDRANEARN